MAKNNLTLEERDFLIVLICKSASERFATDRKRPGVHIAHLPATHDKPAAWYVAIHRYPTETRPYTQHAAASLELSGRGPAPLIVKTAKRDDLDDALLELAQFFAPPPTVAQDELRVLLERSVK